jgi:hypothetical protein
MVAMLGPSTLAGILTAPQSSSFSLLSRHFQPFPTPQPMHPFRVHPPTLLSQLRGDEPVTVTRMRTHQLPHPLHQRRLVVARLRLVTLT